MALSLSMTQNKTGLFFLSVYQSDGVTPQSLVGSVLWFHAALNAFVINKNSPAGGITIQVPAGGTNCATLEIAPADTTALPLAPQGVAGIPCELTLVAGAESFELNSGTLTINANVGTP